MNPDLTSIAAGTSTAGFVVNGVSQGAQVGYMVTMAGDINGDGLADMALFGGSNYYVVFGKTDGSAVSTSNLDSGIGGYKLDASSISISNSYVVGNAGDVNGDGLADILFNNYQTGDTYVVFGKTSTTSVVIGAGIAASDGFRIDGQANANSAGFDSFSASTIGDINGDGLADILIAGGLTNAGGNKAYVVFGKTSGTAVAVTSLAASDGFAIYTSSATQALSASYAGDLNGDGIGDMMIGLGSQNLGSYSQAGAVLS